MWETSLIGINCAKLLNGPNIWSMPTIMAGIGKHCWLKSHENGNRMQNNTSCGEKMKTPHSYD
jgi:hypothetical protein